MPLDPTLNLLASLALLFGALLALWPAWLLLLLAILLHLAISAIEKQRLLASGIAVIDRMNGAAFEAYLAALFEALGYRVIRTPAHRDFGGDLVLEKGGAKTVVQAKRYRGRVGVKAVQEVAAARGYYRAAQALVVTNSTFTRAARTLALANGIELWDRARLIHQLLAVKRSGIPALPVSPDPAVPDREPLPRSVTDDSSKALPFRCARCGAAVSRGVARYCLTHPARFHGAVYCYVHQ